MGNTVVYALPSPETTAGPPNNPLSTQVPGTCRFSGAMHLCVSEPSDGPNPDRFLSRGDVPSPVHPPLKNPQIDSFFDSGAMHLDSHDWPGVRPGVHGTCVSATLPDPGSVVFGWRRSRRFCSLDAGRFCACTIQQNRIIGFSGLAVKIHHVGTIGAKFKVAAGRYRRQQIVFLARFLIFCPFQ